MTRLRWFVALSAILVSATACEQSQETTVNVGSPTAPSTHTTGVSLEADRNTISLNACPGIVALAVTITPSTASQVVTWEWVGPREGVEKTEGAKTFQLSSRQAGVHNITAVHASGARSNTVRVEFIGSCGSGSAAPGAFTLNEGTCSATGLASISWTASAGATHYRVERRTWSTGSWITVGSVSSTSSREFSQQVGRDADYYFRVIAVGNGGETSSSPSERFVCGVSSGPGNPTKTLSISPTSGSGQVGTTQQVVATCRENGNVVSCSPSWSSSTSHLVGVNSTGMVSYSSAGTAEICASWSGIQACGSFTATAAPQPPIITPGSLSLQTAGLGCTNTTGQFTANQSVTWVSSNAGVAAINSSGMVTANSAGSVTITATNANGQQAQATVIVAACIPPVAPTVTLTANPTTVPQHGASQLTWVLTNVTSCTKTGDWSGTVTTSGSSSVVLSEVRTYTFGLTCTGPGGTASASATITVTAPGCPTSISYEVVGGGGNTVAVNQNKSLRVVNWTANSACKPFWYVSDASRAMVIGADEAIVIDGATYYAGVNGLIRGVWPGTVQVCVQTSITANNTKDCKTWTVTVSSSSSTMSAGDTPQLTYMNRSDFAQTFSGLIVLWQF